MKETRWLVEMVDWLNWLTWWPALIEVVWKMQKWNINWRNDESLNWLTRLTWWHGLMDAKMKYINDYLLTGWTGWPWWLVELTDLVDWLNWMTWWPALIEECKHETKWNKKWLVDWLNLVTGWPDWHDGLDDLQQQWLVDWLKWLTGWTGLRWPAWMEECKNKIYIKETMARWLVALVELIN